MTSWKLAALSVCALVTIGDAADAVTGIPRPMSGNAQFYIGSGLPIPIRARKNKSPAGMTCTMATPTVLCTQGAGYTNNPNCLQNTLGEMGYGAGVPGITAIMGATVKTYGGNAGSIRVPTNVFTLRGAGNPQPQLTIGVKSQNPVALQVVTNFQVQFPKAPVGKLKHNIAGVAGKKGGQDPLAPGRTGPDVVTWCPAYTATVVAGSNPGCVGANAHNPISIPTCGVATASGGPGCPGPNKSKQTIKGWMQYTRTGQMLGGPGSGSVQGKFQVAIGQGLFGQGAAVFLQGKPPSGGQHGRSFGNYFQQNVGKGPQFSQVGNNPCGIITNPGVLKLTKAASNKTTGSFGAPQTQGKIVVKAATPTGYEQYTISGYDKRTAMGAGNILLVAGSVGKRSLTGHNANRGFIKLELPEPASIAGAVAALAVLVACHYAVRRRAK